MNNVIDLKVTAATKAHYDRIARIYDLVETLSENRFKPWREKLWNLARGDILEVGVGTGKNFAFHPRAATSSKLAWARARISRFIRLARQ